MNDKKYIFLDVDGTLLNSDGIVADSTKEALAIAQANGHEIFVCSGRARKLIPKQLQDLNFDGYVCGTGTYVEHKDSIIFQQFFSRNQTKFIIDFFVEHNMPFMLSANGSCAGTTTNIALFIECFSEGKIKACDVGNLDDIDTPFFESIMPIAMDDEINNYFDKYPQITDFIFLNSPFIVPELDKILGNEIHAERASFKSPDDYSGEVTLAKFTKATGIKTLLDSVGATVKDSVGVGDGYNDLDMLNFTDLSIAMGNAPADVKQASDYITTNIDDNGVYNAFKKFNLI